MSGKSAWESIPRPKPPQKVEGRPQPKPTKKTTPEPQKTLRETPTPSPHPKNPKAQGKAPEGPQRLVGGMTDREKAEHDSRHRAGGYTGPTPPGQAAKGLDAIRPEFIEVLQGKTYVMYAGLLDLAHRMGLEYIHTTIVQVGRAEDGGKAVVTAECKVDGRVFSGIGDAADDSVSMKTMRPHILRLAETRAKARALRDAVNVGVAALEEMGADLRGDTDGN